LFDQKWKEILQDVKESGITVERGQKRAFREKISYQFQIDDPKDRIIFNKKFGLNIFQCVGQFLWITQGSFNAEAIKYYAPFSSKFSSDGFKMIGAYGPRLFGIHHLEQIKHVIDVLDEDTSRRRAVASIYLPQFDQHKAADEVPCTLNLQYLVREQKVQSVTYMRSQNAFRLLPYDVFLFTMLQEYINAVLTTAHNTGLGKYNHYSGSFHIYMDELSEIEKVLEDNTTETFQMKPMPSKNIILRLQKLNRFESIVRTIITSHEKRSNPVDFNFMFELCEEWFDDPYWKQFALLLVCYGAIIMKNNENRDRAISSLEPIYKYMVQMYIDKHANSS